MDVSKSIWILEPGFFSPAAPFRTANNLKQRSTLMISEPANEFSEIALDRDDIYLGLIKGAAEAS